MELRLKQLEKTKAYRDGLSGLKENVFVQRKRVIIAPKMATVGKRGGNISSLPTVSAKGALKNGKETADSGSLNEKCSGDFDQYKAWVKERKRLRQDLNQCGMVSDWLQSKPSLTDIEKRVQNSGTIAFNTPSSIMKNRKPSPSNEAVNFDSCDSTNLPVIIQPFPVALATIKEYLAKKRLRFYDLFVQADRDKDWKVTGGEFKDAIKRIGIPVKDAEMDQFLLALDENNNDVLEYKELAHGRDLFIVNERMRKHLEEDDEGVNSPVALNPGQNPAQVSSQSLLSLPPMSTTRSDRIFTAKEQDDEKHFKRQRKREKHRQKAKEKVPRQNCTMGGITGMLVDTFQRQKQHEYEQILKLCHLHGVPLSKNLLERVLLHPEDKALDVCVSSLKPSSRYLMSEQDLYSQHTPNNMESGKKRFPKNKPKICLYSYHVYPPATSVTPKSERMNLSSGQANISRKTDCWMTYEEYSNLTRHLDSRFEKSWKPSEEDSYWPSYVFDKVRLYLDRPRTQVRSANSIFDVVHNTTIH